MFKWKIGGFIEKKRLNMIVVKKYELHILLIFNLKYLKRKEKRKKIRRLIFSTFFPTFKHTFNFFYVNLLSVS